MVGLNQTRTRAVGEFSKGMQRRIGLAQALINDPDLVILDEPTSGLDPIGCREVKDLIVALARRGKTVILSSHLLADVEDVCDRVVIYYGGRVQAMGTLKELLTKPDTLRITTPVLPRETLERVLDSHPSRRRRGQSEDRQSHPEPGKLFSGYRAEGAPGGRREPAAPWPARAWRPTSAAERNPSLQPNESWNGLPCPRPTAPAEPATTAPAGPSVDEKKLEGLTKASGPASPEATPAPASNPGDPSVDLSKADEKLSSLLEKPK